MTTSILNRELIPEADTHPIPSTGQEYVPLPDSKDDGVVTASTVQTIQGDPQQLYDLWSDITLFPRWQEHVVSVTPTGDRTSHWVMGNPDDEDGKRIEFDSEITEDVPGQKISWRSISDTVHQTGTVTFVASPEGRAGRGTVVTLIQSVKVPLGSLGNAIAGTAKRSPKQTVIEDLRHFKQIVEAGEIPSVKGQPHGPRGLSGGIKEWMYGENNPTPPGTSEQE